MSEELEGARFFKTLTSGAIFKWMELAQADASQERLDAQSDLIALLKATAKKTEEIEKMEEASEASRTAQKVQS